MTWFDAYDLIALWERDATLPSAEKAVLLCALARPDMAAEDIGAMTIGDRDRVLMDMRARLFGRTIEGMAACGGCGEILEVELDLEDMLALAAHGSASSHELVTPDGVAVRFRLPTAGDALEVAHHEDAHGARHALVCRCVVAAVRDGEAVDAAGLGEAAVAAVSSAIEALDPLSEVRLTLACTGCESDQSVLLDMASYLWAELLAEAERLLADVCFLARGYGWREADILAMSGRRRQFYLDRRPT